MHDATDRRILRHLLADPDAPNSDLAQRAGVTQASLWRRLDRMRATGIIAAIQGRIDWRALGYEVQVSLRFTLDKTDPRAFDDFIAAAREVPEVLEIQTFLGSVDLRLSVIARDAGMETAVSGDTIDDFVFLSVDQLLSDAWLGGRVGTYLDGAAEFFRENGTVPEILPSYAALIDTGPLADVASR